MHKFKTVVISDVHLGTKGSKAKELVTFLKKIECENLFLNGDIIDGWQLKKSGKWRKKHTRFFRLILKLSETTNTKIVYTRGNHDDFLDQIIPLQIGNIEIKREHIYETVSGKYLIIHGDVFDQITSHIKWLAYIGDIGYTFLLWLNRVYNQRRIRRGLPYYSLSQAIKAKVKTAVNFISDFENSLADYARKRDCQGIICGHIHQCSIKVIDGIHYLNSGDWVETLSALVEDYDGNWSVLYHSDLKK